MRQLTVIIAEDELLIRMGIKLSVDWESLGIKLVGDAANGLDALKLCLDLRPDILMADIRMPGIDGIELIERVRTALPNCYVMVITCMNDFDTLRKAMRAGASDYVLKTEMTPETLKLALDKARFSAGKDISGQRARIEPDHALKQKTGWVTILAPVGEVSDMMLSTLKQMVSDSLREISDADIDVVSRIVVAAMELPPTNESAYMDRIERVIEHYRRIFSLAVNAVCAPTLSGENVTLAKRRLLELYEGGYWLKTSEVVLHPSPSWLSQRRMKALEYFINVAIMQDDIPPTVKQTVKQKLSPLQECTPDVWKAKITEAVLSALSADTGVISNALRALVCRAPNAYQAADTIAQFMSDYQYKTMLVKPKRADIDRAMRFMAQNYSRDICVTDIARSVGFSPNYLSNIFHRETGVTLSGYLTRIRVEEAKRLLENTEMLAYEIAEKCGFTDDAYFSRVFKQYTGERPLAYRASREAQKRETGER